MICSLCCLVAFLLVVFLWSFWTRNYKYWEKRGLPAVPAKFPFGSFWSAFTLRSPLFEVVGEAYDRFPDAPLVGMYGPTQPVLLVRDPDLVKRVLVDKFNEFANQGFEVYPSVDPLLGLNPFGTPIPDWEKARSIHSPMFTNSKVKAVMQEIKSSAKKLIEHIRNEKSGVTDLIYVTKMFLVDAVAKSAYGVHPGVWDDPDPLIKNIIADGVISSPFESNVASVCAILLPWMNLITRFKLISTPAHNLMMQIFRAAVPSRRSHSTSTRNDFLQHLVDTDEKLMNSGDKGFSKHEWAAHLMVFFLDGVETSAIALSYAIFLLSKQPEVRERMRQEISEKGITLEDFDFEGVRSLEYMEMVLKESRRKYPPLPLLTRKSTKDTTLGGVFVPNGMKIIVPAYKLQNDPEHHADPEGFDPERFSDKRKSEVRKGTYVPFGAGPRLCVGKNYAETTMKVALAFLLMEFDWTPSPSHGEEIEIEQNSTFFLVPKNGLLEVIFTPIRPN